MLPTLKGKKKIKIKRLFNTARRILDSAADVSHAFPIPHSNVEQ